MATNASLILIDRIISAINRPFHAQGDRFCYIRCREQLTAVRKALRLVVCGRPASQKPFDTFDGQPPCCSRLGVDFETVQRRGGLVDGNGPAEAGATNETPGRR